MEINLISKEQFNIIKDIQEKYPVLTLENKGYEYIQDEFNVQEKVAKSKVVKILKEHIIGFSSFTNFRHEVKTGKLQIRLDYNYNYGNDGLPFTGVGYILLEELLNGFNK